MHTTAWDRLGEDDKTQKQVLIYVTWSCTQGSFNIETDSKKLGLNQNLTSNKNLHFLSYHHKT